MASKQVDRIHIYTGSKDRTGGDASNFTLQAATQLHHTQAATYKVFLQQVVIPNSFQINLGTGGTLLVGQVNTRYVNPASGTLPQDAVFQIRATGTGSYFTATIPVGTYNPSQLVAALNTATYSSGAHFIWAIGPTGCLDVWYGLTGSTSGTACDLMFINPGGNTPTYTGDLMGFGSSTTSSYGQSYTAVSASPYPLFTGPAPLTWSFTIPSGWTTVAALISNLNAQAVAASASFSFSMSTTYGGGYLQFVDSSGNPYAVDIDLRLCPALVPILGYSGTPYFFYDQTTAPTNQYPALVNVLSTIPTSHYVIESTQLSLSAVTASMPVVVSPGQNIVYTDLLGSNASFEKNQDRLTNLNFSLQDELGRAVYPTRDWYMIIAVEVMEDVGNQTAALLAEANVYHRQLLELLHTQAAGTDVDATQQLPYLMKRRREVGLAYQ
jgi:hypothetical protein